MPSRVKRAEVDPIAVGASQVGAILGCDPWTTPLALYRRKVGLDPELEDREAMRIGRYLEGPVIGIARERIPLPVRRNRTTYMHRDLPLFATPDAYVGRDRLLEAKVVGRRAPGWDDDDELPCHVSTQAQAQLLVTGRAACYVAALVGTELKLTLVEADPARQATIAEEVERYVARHLIPRVEPDPLTWEERWEDLMDQRDGLEGEALAGTVAQELGDRLLELRVETSRLADEERQLRLELLAELTDLSVAKLVGTGWTASLVERRAYVATHPASTSFVVRSSSRDR